MSATAENVSALKPEKGIQVRFVTAASLFDGHDASINIMRRILQSSGVEVVHLGHNRSVEDIVTAALQEDVQGVAVSSYQGGHIEYFKYMMDMLRQRGGSHIKVFGGGGGVIVPGEIDELHEYGVARVYSPDDGHTLGLQGMIDDMLSRTRFDPSLESPASITEIPGQGWVALARTITALENNTLVDGQRAELDRMITASSAVVPVLGITGTGGAGKSSLTDELIRRFNMDTANDLRIAILAIDPTRRRTGGALLGDRIRMNAIEHPNIFMRSLATRDTKSEVPGALGDIIETTKLAAVDLIIVETPGIGQGDAGIVPFVDVSLYVMTPEFGAASQLEKIDMLDFADVIAINKFDRRGGVDALRDVSKQVQRNRGSFDASPGSMPVFGTIASRFNDDGMTALYQALRDALRGKGLRECGGRLQRVAVRHSSNEGVIVPPQRQRYLAEIAEILRGYHGDTAGQARIAREIQQLAAARAMLGEDDGPTRPLDKLIDDRQHKLEPRCRKLLDMWPETRSRYSQDEYVVKIREREIRTPLKHETLSGLKFPKVCLPKYHDHGDLMTWLCKENVPGSFPYTAGVFAFKRDGEDPTRMFAGEGDAFRTNKRFKTLSEHSDAKRLSTAFDSVTLYGWDPDPRPDIYGKVGNSGVSIATLDDMKAMYDGFDLCHPKTSVSMTINGPAPTMLAMFLNTAIDQQVEKFRRDNRREPTDEEIMKIREWTLNNVRGTVQADILKEDQGQNTCIFSTDFSLKVMGDIQEFFVHNRVRNFYSVSISGYHIAEAGANPITQLAFTLANGFTYVEAYLARGMHIDEFAPNLSFFFSNGLDPEYSVMGRVARRIWAVTMRDKYGASERSQKLKYHIQTSGRSLHAQEMAFNDIRTTLQALIAVYDNCNSLHTNAYDEAVTTPTGESVRRAVAIQLIINREWGLAGNENPNQGSFILEELTDLVEEAVLCEFERISERGGVLGAMERGYQRGKIQDESLYYESRKHDGSYPIVGVNTFLDPNPVHEPGEVKLARSTDREKDSQLSRLDEFKQRNQVQSSAALERLKHAAACNENIFSELMDAVRYCSLGQITHALFEVGGQYRRNM